jgi:4-hydroxy-3-methylbut-2-enyl diphosphate reductase
VTVTHDLVRDLVAKGYYILYIGKKGHPEPEGVMGEIPGHVSLVETEADVDELVLTPSQEENLAVSTQTTLSKWDTQRVIQRIKTRYPHAEIHIDICAATQSRQEAVAEQARGADLTIVVGDPRSNNTNRLVQVSEELAGVPAIRIENLAQLQTAWLKGKKRIAVTSGTSTPSRLTREVVQYLEQYQPE